MRRLLVYLRPYWRQVAVAFVAIIVGSAASLAQPYLIKIAIDRYIAQRQLAGLDRLAALYLAVLVASFAAEYVQTWTMQLTGQRIMFDLRMAIYRHLQRLDLRYYDRNPVGRLMTRVTSDVDVLNDLFTSGVVTIFGDVFTLVGIMGVMLWMNWRLALVAFSVLPLIVLVTQWFRRNVRDSYRVVRGLIARINAFLQENITGMSTVQLFRREALNFARFDDDRPRAPRRQHRVDLLLRGVLSGDRSGQRAGVGADHLVRRRQRAAQTLTLGALVAFLQYSQRFFRPISDMSEKFNILQSAMASSERIFKLLDEPVVIESPAQPAARPAPAPGHIGFDHVWFAYNDDDWVLKDVSFEVRPGERVGIVGATGSGKTTLINLLLRFYDVQRGRITVDGVDIRAARSRRPARPVQPRAAGRASVLGHDRRQHPARRIRRSTTSACARPPRAVHAEPFIERLPGGYASAVAERGSTLSVGQKQLLSFARALAFDPRVLVLDEATSSVDTETELLIRDALHVLMAGRTTIAIAHRLSTIQDMDKILVLHKGQLREAGTHQELLAQRGIYFKLFELQYRDRQKFEVKSEKLEVRRIEVPLELDSASEFYVPSTKFPKGHACGSGRAGRTSGSAERLKKRSRKLGVVARGFQPRRSTVR